ncbi:MAG: transposase [Tepidisphaeraceae bacterium]
MPRTARIAPGGVIYHVLNRGVGGTTLFRSAGDYLAFHGALIDTLALFPTMRILAFCIMPNHWHLLLWPTKDGDLARFMQRLTITHARRWLEYRDRVGTGHVYQGRYKSFAMETDGHLFTVGRYVERNALRAGLAKRAELWRFSSIGQELLEPSLRVPLSDWPIARRRDWIDWVNLPQTPREEEAIRRSIREARPYGSEAWVKRTMTKLGWREPARPGRPKKPK